VQNAISYDDRGIAKQKKGDLDGAMADFTQAIKLGAKSGDGDSRLRVIRRKASLCSLGEELRLTTILFRWPDLKG
jgi:hypothetical protein